MPPKTIALLSVSCGSVCAAYLALMIAAVFFAAWENTLSSSARDAEMRIAALETEYFAAIDTLQGADLATIGLAEPSRVEYVAEAGTPAVTRATR